MLTVQRWSGEHQLQMWVRPENYGKYEDEFFAWGLYTLADYPRFPVALELSTEHTAALEAAKDHGFQVTRSLLTMRRRIEDKVGSGE